ncbi:MAG: hypothetical protein ACK55I_26540, partial [bacterium]
MNTRTLEQSCGISQTLLRTRHLVFEPNNFRNSFILSINRVLIFVKGWFYIIIVSDLIFLIST